VEIGIRALSDPRLALEELTGREADLVNLRQSPIVLEKEVIASGIRIFVKEASAVDEYEMLVFSFSGKINEERADILKEFARASSRSIWRITSFATGSSASRKTAQDLRPARCRTDDRAGTRR